MSPTEEKSDDVDFGDNIDMTTFEQILEMDEPGDCEFSSSIVFGFFEQAEETFDQIQEALEEEDLDKLSSLGHFLKGSSATLGLIKIRDGCEKIQRYGKHEKLDGSPEDDSEVCLKHINDAFKAVKTDYSEVEKLLRQYYDSRE